MGPRREGHSLKKLVDLDRLHMFLIQVTMGKGEPLVFETQEDFR